MLKEASTGLTPYSKATDPRHNEPGYLKMSIIEIGFLLPATSQRLVDIYQRI